MQASLRSSDYQPHHYRNHHHQEQQRHQHQHESQQLYYGYATNSNVGQAPIDCVASLLRQHNQVSPQDYLDQSQEISDPATGAPKAANATAAAAVLPHHAPHSINQHLELLEDETDFEHEQQQQPEQTFRASDYDRYLAFGHGEQQHQHPQQQQQHLTDDRDDDRIFCYNHEKQHQNFDQYQLAGATVPGEHDSLSTVILDGEDPTRREPQLQQQQQQHFDYSYHQADQSGYYELTAVGCDQEQFSDHKPGAVGINLNIDHKQPKIERQEIFRQHLYDAITATTASVAAQQQTPDANVQLQAHQLRMVPDEYQQQHHHLAETSYHQNQSMVALTATTTKTTMTDLSGAYLDCDEQEVASSLGFVQPADQVQLPSHLYGPKYKATFSEAELHQDNTDSCHHSLNRLGPFIVDGHQSANVGPLFVDNADIVQRQQSHDTYDSSAFNHDHYQNHTNYHRHQRMDYHHVKANSMRNYDSSGIQGDKADEGPSRLQYVTDNDQFQQHHHNAPAVNEPTGSNSIRNSYSSAISTSSSSSSSSSTNSSSSSSRSIGSDVDSFDSTMPRDEKKAREANIPLSYNEIVNLSIEQFNEHISRFHFTDAQLTLMRDIRRRGKNKVAAQTCRRRKMEQITELQHELNHLSNKRLSLSCERSRLTQEHCRLTEDYEKLYSIIQSHMN